MIPLWLTSLGFIILASLTNSRTFLVLAISALANMFIDNFTQSDSQYLMVMYSSIELATGIAIIKCGDIQKVYQSVILLLMMMAHFIMELALVYDNIIIIESNIYIYTISCLILAQMIGVGRVDKLYTLFGPDYHPAANRGTYHSHCHKSN